QMKRPMHSRARNSHHPCSRIQVRVLHSRVPHCHVLPATSSYSIARAPCSARFQFCARRATFPRPAPQTAPPEALCPLRLPNKVRRCHPRAKNSPENLRPLLSLAEIRSQSLRAASAILPTPASPAELLALPAIPFREDFQ